MSRLVPCYSTINPLIQYFLGSCHMPAAILDDGERHFKNEAKSLVHGDLSEEKKQVLCGSGGIVF